MTYSYSTDGELFDGEYETPEAAAAAEPMNAAHEILMKAASGMCSQEIAAPTTTQSTCPSAGR